MGRTRRKKKHSHVPVDGSESKPTPHTFVMERGKVGRMLSQLVLDMRRVMEPHTASKLKVRQRNVLMDFVQVAGPLGVTHFMIISRTETHVNLRLCRLPRGPTITFHINNFSLTKDVTSSIRKPANSLTQYMTAPLLILNNFSAEDKPSKLMATMLQNMLPSINIQTVKLANINRCVLFNYDTDTKTIEFRHYNIRAVARGISRGVKRLGKQNVPNLSRYTDISDYMLGGYVSESEGEEMAAQEVTLPQDLPGRGNTRSSQSAVRLTELGPRLTLQLVKVEAGLCKGEVLHHEFIQKSKREARTVRKRVEERTRLKQSRKKQQEDNIARKKMEREQHKLRCLEGQRSKERNAESESDTSGSEGDDDTEWYRQEVGEDPDPGDGISQYSDVLVPSQSNKRKRCGNSEVTQPPTKFHCDKSRRGRKREGGRAHSSGGVGEGRDGKMMSRGMKAGGRGRPPLVGKFISKKKAGGWRNGNKKQFSNRGRTGKSFQKRTK